MLITVESRPLAGEINIFEGEEKVTNLFFSGCGVLTYVVIVKNSHNASDLEMTFNDLQMTLGDLETLKIL